MRYGKIFRAIPFRNTLQNASIADRLFHGVHPQKDIRGKSALPALEGRHFLLTFCCC